MFRLSMIAIAAAALPASAYAKPANGSFRTTAYVPEFCRISASPLVVSEDSGSLQGQVFEMCNSQHGYTVVAVHRPLDTKEHVDFEFAGKQSRLQSHGWSEIAQRTGARYGLRNVNVRYTDLSAPLAINLTVTAY